MLSDTLTKAVELVLILLPFSSYSSWLHLKKDPVIRLPQSLTFPQVSAMLLPYQFSPKVGRGQFFRNAHKPRFDGK